MERIPQLPFPRAGLFLLSMTGHGEGHIAHPRGGTIGVEVRTVNNRHLKLNLRTGSGLAAIEPAIETLVRSSIRRGSVQMNVNWMGRPQLDLYQIQAPVVHSYLQQCRNLAEQYGFDTNVTWAELLALPGVLTESFGTRDDSPDLEAVVLQAVSAALNQVQHTRATEGASMARELDQQLQNLRRLTDEIEQRAPQILVEYRQRLKARVVAAIAEATAGGATPIQVSDQDLIREVALISDKTDIREEIVRLNSHFVQFHTLIHGSESHGRRLDFLIQEIFREANTIGSKASDAAVAQQVVELKTILEQMRELVQNVE